MAEYTYSEDIDALAAFLMKARNCDDPWADPDHAKDWSRALTALVAERDALVKERNSLVWERSALAQRVAELEAQLPAATNRDLRERLVCAAFAGLAAHPSDDHPMRHLRELAEKSVNAADAMLAAMRKGDGDGK